MMILWTVLLQILRWLEYAVFVCVYSIPWVRRNMVPDVPWDRVKAIFTSWKASKIIYAAYSAERDKVVYKGGPPYNADVLSMTNQPMKLLDFLKAGRPLIVDFGSAT